MMIKTTLVFSLACGAIACTSDGGASDDADGSSDSDAGSSSGAASDGSSGGASGGSSSGGAAIDPVYDCVDPMPTVARPLSGPGYDPETGLVDPQDSYVVSTTQILPRPEKQSDFLALANASVEAAEATDGVVAISLVVEPTCGFARTLTVWRSEAAMMTFAAGAVHADAMSKTFEVGVTGRVTHFEIAAADMPITWDAAIAEIADVVPFGY